MSLTPRCLLPPSSPLSLLSLSSWLSSLWLPLAPVEERGSCGAILSTRVSHFSSPGVVEECEARVEVQDGVCHLRLQYEELSPASGCLLVSKGRKGEGGSRLCGSRGGLETLLPVGRKEQVYLTTDSLARWKVRLVQEQCSRANSRLLLLQEDQGQAQCPAHRARRAAPATMLEIAQKRARGKVASAFFQVVEASNMELSRATKSPSSQVQSSQRNQSGKQRRRKKQRRRRRRKLSSIFPAPLPGWLGRISRPSGPPCPAFLLSPLTALCPAPCLLQGPTSNLTLRLGPHTRPVSGVLLHPSRQGPQPGPPLPARPPAPQPAPRLPLLPHQQVLQAPPPRPLPAPPQCPDRQQEEVRQAGQGRGLCAPGGRGQAQARRPHGEGRGPGGAVQQEVLV